VWPCDLILASEDAYFRDPTVNFGIGGIPLPGHTWEYGPRLAKEMLFLGNRVPATRLFQMGMVNRIVPRDQLQGEALAVAREISAKPTAAVRNAKRVVNMTMDIIGQHYMANRFFELVDDLPVTQIGRRSSTDRWDPTPPK
jgi:enoyl-CoA hydratase/carnithine racemase